MRSGVVRDEIGGRKNLDEKSLYDYLCYEVIIKLIQIITLRKYNFLCYKIFFILKMIGSN